MKIIFMGTPEFSCPTLEKLLADPDFELVGVYTREPQIAGRGHKLQNSPIHNLALKNGLKVFTPKTLRNKEVQDEFCQLGADAAVVVAYGLILPREILSAPKFGCINIHPSLLPRWRGAAPIQRTLMEGDLETAVTIIKMDEGVDSGDMILQQNFKLNGDETYAKLAEKFSAIGASMLVQALKKLRDGQAVLTKQDNALASYAKKIEKAECEINWQDLAKKIEQKIRALNGSLGAYFMLNDEKIKIFSAQIIDEKSCEKKAGEILNDQFFIQCGQGIIRPLILQRQGKKAIEIDEFLRGFKTNSQQ